VVHTKGRDQSKKREGMDNAAVGRCCAFSAKSEGGKKTERWKVSWWGKKREKEGGCLRNEKERTDTNNERGGVNGKLRKNNFPLKVSFFLSESKGKKRGEGGCQKKNKTRRRGGTPTNKGKGALLGTI